MIILSKLPVPYSNWGWWWFPCKNFAASINYSVFRKKKFLVKNVITFVLLRPEARLTCECFVRELNELLKSQFCRWRSPILDANRHSGYGDACDQPLIYTIQYYRHAGAVLYWLWMRRSARCGVCCSVYRIWIFSQYIQQWKYIQSHVDGWSKRMKKTSLSQHT